LASQSAENGATISPLIEISAQPVARVGTQFLIRGSLQPRTSNVSLVVEKIVNGLWQKVTLKSAQVSDGSGSFAIALTDASEGFVSYRVRTGATAALESAVSSPITIVIK
jgi:hypothetical protein